MWFVFSLGGISTVPPAHVENVVSFEEQSNPWGESRASGEKCLLRGGVRDVSALAGSGGRGRRPLDRLDPAVSRFNWVFEEQVFAAPTT